LVKSGSTSAPSIAKTGFTKIAATIVNSKKIRALKRILDITIT
jgi:hypothetical protein